MRLEIGTIGDKTELSQYHNLLDIAVGPHLHDWINYYSLVSRTWGVDINPNVDGLKDCDTVSILDCNLKLPFRDRYFDLVLSDHTIEHLTNPSEFFQELQRIGEKMIILKTPQGWQDNFFKPRQFIKTDHKYHFTKSWFIRNTLANWNISTRTHPRLGSGPSEIEIILRRVSS